MKIKESMYWLARKLTNTCDPCTPDSMYIGGFRIADLPQRIDDFMRLWLINYEKMMWWFWIFRPLVEWLFIKRRFINYTEYQAIFDEEVTKPLRSTKIRDSSTILSDIHVRYPVFRLAGVTSERRRQEFILRYKNDTDSYFHFMKEKNMKLYNIFFEWHKAAIPTEHRIHSWITGTPGFGKSELMKSMILQDIRTNLKKNTSIVVIDPNGDFVKEVAQFKELSDPEMQKKVIYIDPDLFNGEYSAVLNPFDLFDKNSEKEIVLTNQQLSKALSEIFEAEKQPFTNQMKAILYNCTTVLLEMQNSSLWDLQQFMVKDRNADLIQRGLQSQFPATRLFFRDKFDDKQYIESKNGIYTKIQRLLNIPYFANMVTGRSSINLGQSINDNKLILINLSFGKIGDEAPTFIGKVLIALLQSVAFQRASLEKNERNPVYVYCDEFHDLINPSIMKILTQARKYKMFMTVANQFVGQGMTTEEEETLLSTTKVKLIGYNSNKSLQALSKETDAEMKLLKKLSRGRFMVKIGQGEPFILEASKESLDNKNSMTDKTWNAIVQQQKSKYYRKKPTDAIMARIEATNNGSSEQLYQQAPTPESVKFEPRRSAVKQKPQFNPKYSK